MRKENYIVYQGVKKIIEWYFDNRGRMPAEEYWEELTIARKKKVIELFELLADKGEVKNKKKFIHEGDGIYAFKPNEDRFFCFFFAGAKVIITNAYQKQSNKMPTGEKNKALGYRNDYEKRIALGKYYEKES